MPYKDIFKRREYGKQYSKEYYEKHKQEVAKYKKTRREKDRAVWNKYWARRQDKERRRKIQLDQIYKPKKKSPISF